MVAVRCQSGSTGGPIDGEHLESVFETGVRVPAAAARCGPMAPAHGPWERRW